jgi:hypothetical protein
MDKTFVVAFMTFGENELNLELIQAPDWLTAAKKHSKSLFNYDELEEHEVATVEAARRHAFDLDGGFSILEVAAGPGDCTIMGWDPSETPYGIPVTVTDDSTDATALGINITNINIKPVDLEADAAKSDDDPTKGFDV